MLHPAQLLQWVLVLAVAMPPLPDTNCCCAQAREASAACCKVKQLEATASEGCPHCRKAARLANESQQYSRSTISRKCDCGRELRENPRLATTVRSALRRAEVAPILFESFQPVSVTVQGPIFGPAAHLPPVDPLSVQVMYGVWLT